MKPHPRLLTGLAAALFVVGEAVCCWSIAYSDPAIAAIGFGLKAHALIWAWAARHHWRIERITQGSAFVADTMSRTTRGTGSSTHMTARCTPRLASRERP